MRLTLTVSPEQRKPLINALRCLCGMAEEGNIRPVQPNSVEHSAVRGILDQLLELTASAKSKAHCAHCGKPLDPEAGVQIINGNLRAAIHLDCWYDPEFAKQTIGGYLDGLLTETDRKEGLRLYHFKVELCGEGETPDEAWADAILAVMEEDLGGTPGEYTVEELNTE